MFSKFTRQIQDMQKKMLETQENLRSMQLEGQSAGGAVKVVISGEGKLLQLSLSPEMLQDADMVEDSIIAAYHNAWEILKEKREGSMKELKIPPGLEGMF
ncbi:MULTISPECIES: YbaB/EbfC family nucleoid-associated protein [Holospora]|uniref:Nucleoid-associated protein K737_300223 n=2 Tax=Holospora TaxID=44747 RepID=A0A061JIF7_9PROT|nr:MULTISPECIES: YbaB/EbfC family nucleoid-associated protein [Holospora]ETZ05343.1 nucleoid-associated protein [Holospora undulata HU1]GAJ46692.1 nucleoid-associated protein [Holospora elegans E1]